MPYVESVNLGSARPVGSKSGLTGIDKRPVDTPIEVRAPGPKGMSGLVGDRICDAGSHGGDDQAVYAYAREDLSDWQATLGGPLRSGMFGENLTTVGLDITHALIGERWRIGRDTILQVTTPRIPCKTFAAWLNRTGWVKTFTSRGVPGAYLRVVRPGMVRAGDRITIENRPDHDVTINLVFRALTTQPDLLARLVDIAELPAEEREQARRRVESRRFYDESAHTAADRHLE